MMNNIIAVEIDPHSGYYFSRETEVKKSVTLEEEIIKPAVEEKFIKPLSGGILEYHGKDNSGFIEEEEESWEEEE